MKGLCHAKYSACTVPGPYGSRGRDCLLAPAAFSAGASLGQASAARVFRRDPAPPTAPRCKRSSVTPAGGCVGASRELCVASGVERHLRPESASAGSSLRQCDLESIHGATQCDSCS